MDSIRHPLDALGSATRRALLEQLAPGPLTVGALAETVAISRPAVSQQLVVLEEAGLVQMERRGRQRVVRLRPEGLRPARDFLDTLWPEALARFAQLAESTWSEP